MKNKRKISPLAAAATVYISITAVPIYAGAPCAIPEKTTGITVISPDDPYFQDIQDILDMYPSDIGTLSYIIDFFDQDGSLLDSKICQYGDRLEDIPTPGPKEDGQYIYRPSGWEPQLPETVTGSMAFTAVYQKTAKDTVSGPALREMPDRITKASSDGSDQAPERITQVSSTSYDVTPFHIETPGARPEETPVFPDTRSMDDLSALRPQSQNETRTSPAPAAPEDTETVNMAETLETPVPTTKTEPHTGGHPQADLYTYTENETTSDPAESEDKSTLLPPETPATIAATTAQATPTTTEAPAATCPPERPAQTSESRSPLPVLLIGTVACGSAVCLKDR